MPFSHQLRTHLVELCAEAFREKLLIALHVHTYIPYFFGLRSKATCKRMHAQTQKWMSSLLSLLVSPSVAALPSAGRPAVSSLRIAWLEVGHPGLGYYDALQAPLRTLGHEVTELSSRSPTRGFRAGALPPMLASVDVVLVGFGWFPMERGVPPRIDELSVACKGWDARQDEHEAAAEQVHGKGGGRLAHRNHSREEAGVESRGRREQRDGGVKSDGGSCLCGRLPIVVIINKVTDLHACLLVVLSLT